MKYINFQDYGLVKGNAEDDKAFMLSTNTNCKAIAECLANHNGTARNFWYINN